MGRVEENQRKPLEALLGSIKPLKVTHLHKGLCRECLQSRFLSMFWHDKGFKTDGYNMSIIKPFPDNSIAIPCPLRIGRTAALSTFIAFIYTYVSNSIPWFH